jgi:hypothetical protein
LLTKELITIKQTDIEDQKVSGSAMPAGLTTLLAEHQLFDFIKFLSQLGSFQ